MILLVILTKMIACSGILYGYYWFFLRNHLFHHYNRFYLLGATALSLTFPLLKIPVLLNGGTAAGEIMYRSIHDISVNRWQDDLVETGRTDTLSSWVSIENLSILFYSLVTIVLLVVLLRSLFYILMLAKKYPCQYLEAWKFFNTAEPGTPFSFFRLIFWNNNIDLSSKEGQQILRHEIYHVKQQHSADIIFMELATIFIWINPFFHFMKKELRAIHEFLADRHAVSNHDGHDYAELLIVQSLRIKSSPISNYFFQNHIKRRIAMITQFGPNRYGYLRRLLVLPLSILLFCAIALYAKPPGKGGAAKKTMQKSSRTLTVLIDAGHGGKDDGAKSNGLKEKDFTLAIARQIKKNALPFNVNVVMTRDEDSYPSLRERSGKATASKVDLLVSIHVASSEKPNEQSGFDIFITKRNENTVSQSRSLGEKIADEIKNIYDFNAIKQTNKTGIWMLDSVNIPAVLIECGYLTSDKDVAFISNEENQKKIAEAILRGLTSYQPSDRTSITIDTVPQVKKGSKSELIGDSMREVHKKKAADQVKEMEKRQLELEALHDVQHRKNSEFEKVQQKLDERRLAILANQDKLIAKMHKMREAELQDAAKWRQEKLAEEPENKSQLMEQDLKRKNEMMEELQFKLQKELDVQLKRQAELEKKQQMILEKQQQLEIDHKKKINLQYNEFENMKKKLENQRKLKEAAKIKNNEFATNWHELHA